MSILIDSLVGRASNYAQCEIDGKWVIAKGYPYLTWRELLRRVKDAVRVLTGKAEAYHYYADCRKDVQE